MRKKLPAPKQMVCISTDEAELLGIKVSHQCKVAKREVELELTRKAKCPFCEIIFQMETEKVAQK